MVMNFNHGDRVHPKISELWWGDFFHPPLAYLMDCPYNIENMLSNLHKNIKI